MPALLTTIAIAALISTPTGRPLIAKLTDAKIDSVFVLYFHDPADDDDGGMDEAVSDFADHTSQALDPIRNWRMVTVEKRADQAAYRKFNPGDSLLFQIRFRGRQVMQSAGVEDGEAISAALRAVGALKTVPPDPDEE